MISKMQTISKNESANKITKSNNKQNINAKCKNKSVNKITKFND